MGSLTRDGRFTGLAGHVMAHSPMVLGFSTTVPTSGPGNITEPSGNNYARTEISFGSVDSTQDPAFVLNDEAIVTNVATGSWGEILFAIIFADNGAALHYIDLRDGEGDGIIVDNGDRLIVEEGELGITLS